MDVETLRAVRDIILEQKRLCDAARNIKEARDFMFDEFSKSEAFIKYETVASEARSNAFTSMIVMLNMMLADSHMEKTNDPT